MRMFGRLILFGIGAWAVLIFLRLIDVVKVHWLIVLSPLVVVFGFVMWIVGLLAAAMRWLAN